MGIMQLLNLILFWLFFGLVASHFAKKRGRNPFGWFFIGLFLGLVGLILLFILPKNQKTSPPRNSSSPIPRQSEAWIKLWYYLDPSHQQQGPIEFPDLIKYWKQQSITENSYIWGEGMKEWRPLSELPELLQEIKQN